MLWMVSILVSGLWMTTKFSFKCFTLVLKIHMHPNDTRKLEKLSLYSTKTALHVPFLFALWGGNVCFDWMLALYIILSELLYARAILNLHVSTRSKGRCKVVCYPVALINNAHGYKSPVESFEPMQAWIQYIKLDNCTCMASTNRSPSETALLLPEMYLGLVG